MATLSASFNQTTFFEGFAVLRKMISVFCLSLVSVLSLGCGGGVDPGVADGQEEAPPVLTPEETQTEEESARNAAGQ
jgi:hypothetical protein